MTLIKILDEYKWCILGGIALIAIILDQSFRR